MRWADQEVNPPLLNDHVRCPDREGTAVLLLPVITTVQGKETVKRL